MADIAQKFDDVLRNLAGQAGSLETLLGVFFSFLHRNTDFYVTFDPVKTAKAGMGFPSGKAEQLLLRAFRSFPYKPYGGDGEDRQRPRSSPGGKGGRSTSSPAGPLPAATAPSSGPTSRKETPSSVAGSAGTSGRGALVTKSKAAAEAPTTSASASPPAQTAHAPGGNAGAPSPPAQPARPAAGEMRVRYTKDGKQVPIGNGGVTRRYYWTQTVNEATVYVDVPPGTRSKDVECVIRPRRLKLRVRGAGAATGGARTADGGGAAPGGDIEGEVGDGDLIFDGELPSAVSREDSMWSLNDGTTVVISFEKTTKSWWKSVVEGDPEIDTSKVDSTTKISEYDGETQGAIRKIMFDQRQKSLGLPTSDQLNADAVLERAKSLPGSPFLPGDVLFDGAGRGDVTGVSGVCDGGDGRLAPDGGDLQPPNPPE
eukprot:g11900.t1